MSASLGDTRNDIFLSFHGSEKLWPSYSTKRPDGEEWYTLRDLVESLEGDLQHQWVHEKGRIGNLEVFFDDTKLTNSPNSDIKASIINGLLQTQGGGVFAVIASKGYFESKWCLFELLAASFLASVDEVTICFIGIGLSVKEIDEKTSFLNEQGFAKNKFQYHIIDPKRHDSIRQIADCILSRGVGVMAGQTAEDCRRNLIEETVRVIQRNDDWKDSLCAEFGFENSQELVLTKLTNRCTSNPTEFLNTLRRYLQSRPMDIACKEKLDAFERKWPSLVSWDDARQKLEALYDTAE